MRSIVHLSDIHFGRLNHEVVDPLVETIKQINPDLVAVSGDLTQRARSHQFKEARAFLDRLPNPQIVVPGNHDVPLHNVWMRFMQPLDKYRRFITEDLRPVHQDEEIAVIGLNTARSLTIKGGRINESQVAWMREKLCDLDEKIVRIVVTHHPFDLPEGHDERDLVGRARMAMETLASCGADIFLAGHLHAGQITLPLPGGRIPLAHPRWRYIHGLYRRNGATLHVSAGLGTTFVPFRFLARPEATELVLVESR